MKLTITNLCFFFAITLSIKGQEVNFSRVLQLPPTPQLVADIGGYGYGCQVTGDINGDEYVDIVISGYNLDNEATTDVYFNDGLGNLTYNENSIFDGIVDGDLELGDVDLDGDLDLFVCGVDLDYNDIHKLYLNDGIGNFTSSSIPLSGYVDVENILVDVDGDDDLDYIVSGLSILNFEHQAELYINDGVGNFFLQSHSDIIGFDHPTIRVLDIDGDSDIDLWMTGLDESWSQFNTFLTNDGTGNFTSHENVFPINTVYSDFADVDGDGDQDALISIQISSSINQLSLWTNDGLGNFLEYSVIRENSNLESFVDIDIDGDFDIISITDSSYVYLNDGLGNYEVSGITSITSGSYSSIAISDFNDDNLPDVFNLSDGDSYGQIPKSPICINDGNNNLFEILASPIGHLDWAELTPFDMDNDGDLDLLLCGRYNELNPDMFLYSNDGHGNLTSTSFTEGEILKRANFDAGDIDGDGDIDLIQSGSTIEWSEDSERLNFYINDGSGNFELRTNHGLHILSSKVFLFDIDGDNDLDLYQDGFDLGNSHSNHLYINDGFGNFSEIMDHGLPLIQNSMDLEVADLDGDGDLDIAMNGSTNPLLGISKSYILKNDGFGHFEEVNIPNMNHCFGDTEIFDADGNGTLDVAFVGNNGSKIWLNDGMGEFTESLTAFFPETGTFDLEAEDYDLDGDVDMIISGLLNEQLFTKYLENVGSGVYSENSSVILPPMYRGELLSEDFNLDGKSDLIIVGAILPELSFSHVYHNSTCTSTTNMLAANACDSYTSPSGETWAVSGIYEDIIINEEGCDSLITIDLEILTSTSSNINMFSCDEIYSPSGDFVWTESGLYEDIIPNEIGCDSIITIDVTIDSFDNNITQSGSTLSVVANSFSYQWYDCYSNIPIDGAVNSTYDVQQNGNYSCEITSINGCSNFTDCHETIINGISDIRLNFLAQIGPNPFQNNLQLNIASKEKVSLQLYNISGEIVYENQWSNTEKNIMVYPNVSPGVYFARLTVGKEVQITKLMKIE